MGDLDLITGRSWDWLLVRILGLFNLPPLIAPDGTALPATRIGWMLNPPAMSGTAE